MHLRSISSCSVLRFKTQLDIFIGSVADLPCLSEFNNSQNSVIEFRIEQTNISKHKGCDGCCVFCLYCDAWICRCSCMGGMSVLSCICCMFVSCVHHAVVLNVIFCMTCSLLMLVEDAKGDHMEEAYSRAGLITAL